MSLDQFAQADAAHEEYVREHWRDWIRYLHAHRTLIDVREDERQLTTAFERTQNEEREATATRDLAEIQQQRRVRFDAVRDSERQQAAVELEAAHRAAGHLHPLDADTVERTAIDRLLRVAEGHAREPGVGLVPIEGTWYRVDANALLNAPQDAHYALLRAESTDKRRRLIVGMVLVGLAVVFLMVYYLVPASAVAAPIAAPTINGTEHPDWFWPLHTVTLRGPGVDPLTVVLTPTTTLAWPTPDGQAVGFWLTRRAWPTTICMASDVALDAYTEATLTATGAAPTRHYRLGAALAVPSPPDLALVPCAGGDGRVGILQDVTSPPLADLATPIHLADGSVITPTDVQVIGPGEEPTLPPNQAAVLITVVSDRAQEWALRAPTLILMSGQQGLPATSAEPITAGMRLRYLIPLPDQPHAAVWSVQDPDGMVYQWSLNLVPPQPRLELLRAALSVTRATVSMHGSSVVLQFTLTNVGTPDLRLVRDDVTVASGTNLVAVPIPPDIETPLARGAQRTMTLTLDSRQVVPGRPLTITIGPLQYQVMAGAEEHAPV